MLKTINTPKTLSLCLLLVAGHLILLPAFAENTLFNNHANELGYATSTTNNTASFIVPGTTIDGYSFGQDEANRLAKNNVFIGSDSKNCYLDLASGNVLLHPEKDMIVSTASGKIHIGAGATVFIIDSGSDLVVYNLAQVKEKQVAVITGKYKLLIAPGRLVVLSADHTKDFEQLAVNCHSIPYQNAKQLDLGGQAVNIFTADFSVASALKIIQPLKDGAELAVKQKTDKVVHSRGNKTD